MKNLLMLLVNLITWFYTIFVDLLGILWYGKLPKVSTYHALKENYSFKDIFNNKNIQSIKNPVLNRKQLMDLLYEVSKECDDLPDTVEIRDRKGKIIGETGLYGYLEEKFRNKLNN